MEKYHQAFKWDFVAGMPIEGGTNKREDVMSWLDEKREVNQLFMEIISAIVFLAILYLIAEILTKEKKMKEITAEPCFDRWCAELCVKHGILEQITDWENSGDDIRMEWLERLWEKGVFAINVEEDDDNEFVTTDYDICEDCGNDPCRCKKDDPRWVIEISRTQMFWQSCPECHEGQYITDDPKLIYYSLIDWDYCPWCGIKLLPPKEGE